MLKRALGYEYTETTREYIPELDEMKTTKKVTKQVAPDTTAQIFWLKNRKPDKWRDKLNRDCGSEDETEGVEIINDADKETD